ncbi:hypothetical protein DFH11DRAFT_1787713 [Phellopilus nigrolimitatus]|nr:hypothetical protein DFH11DRAFT_1787713 [Phellopilus nigrolimitatus]
MVLLFAGDVDDNGRDNGNDLGEGRGDEGIGEFLSPWPRSLSLSCLSPKSFLRSNAASRVSLSLSLSLRAGAAADEGERNCSGRWGAVDADERESVLDDDGGGDCTVSSLDDWRSVLDLDWPRLRPMMPSEPSSRHLPLRAPETTCRRPAIPLTQCLRRQRRERRQRGRCIACIHVAHVRQFSSALRPAVRRLSKVYMRATSTSSIQPQSRRHCDPLSFGVRTRYPRAGRWTGTVRIVGSLLAAAIRVKIHISHGAHWSFKHFSWTFDSTTYSHVFETSFTRSHLNVSMG